MGKKDGKGGGAGKPGGGAAVAAAGKPGGKKKEASEIDDIFSAKPAKKPEAGAGVSGGALGLQDKAISKKEKKKKQKKGDVAGRGVGDAGVETTVFTETLAPQQGPGGAGGAKGKKFTMEDDELMSSLLGTGPRKTTEEGYRIFKEGELNMNKGGDTDLCPFDCACCF